MVAYVLATILQFVAVRVDVGALSVYAPGDGWNSGKLACGGQFTKEQIHIAYRSWRKVGCGREVLVCAEATQRCELATVQDAGPFGIITGPLKGAYPKRWRVFTGPGKPPEGWRYRAVADLSWGLWKRLGRPRGLSRIELVFLPKGFSAWVRAWVRVREVAQRQVPTVL